MSETMNEEREHIQRRILALRRSRDTYAAYGDVAKADQLLDEIGSLEQQLSETHKPGRKPQAEKEDNQ